MTNTRAKSDTYHHGDLHAALLKAAEAILKRDGLNALTLRACAREAGVSHGAPANHFVNVTGMLSELAALGFDRLSDSMDAITNKPGFAMKETGRTYVAFAKQNAALFQLMSDPSRVDADNPRLKTARQRAMTTLAGIRGVTSSSPTLQQVGLMTGMLSLVHGFSILLITGRLQGLLSIAPNGTTANDLLEMTLSFSDLVKTSSASSATDADNVVQPRSRRAGAGVKRERGS